MGDFSSLPSNTWNAVKTTAASIPVTRAENSLKMKKDP